MFSNAPAFKFSGLKLRPGFFLVAVLAQFLFALVLIHLFLALFTCPRHEKLLS